MIGRCGAILASILLLATPRVGGSGEILDLGRLDRECKGGSRRACLKLAEIAKTSGNEMSFIQVAAVAALPDMALLADVATHAALAKARQAAVGKLADQNVLLQVAAGDRDAGVRAAAAARLDDGAALARIATSDPERSVREAAVRNEHLVDGSLLAELARREPALRFSALANPHLVDQLALADNEVPEDRAGLGVRIAAHPPGHQPIQAAGDDQEGHVEVDLESDRGGEGVHVEEADGVGEGRRP